MKGFGVFLLIVGVIAALASLAMDVTVMAGSYGGRVNNIGLMAQRQNYIMISCFVILCGLIMVIFGGRRSKESTEITPNKIYVKCRFCAELISPEAIKCKHCGSDLTSVNSSAENASVIFDPNELIVQIKNGFIISSEGLTKYINYLQAKKPDSMDLLTDLQEEINNTRESLPPGVREAFRHKVNHLLKK